MKEDALYIGQMDHYIEVIEKQASKSTTGEPIETDVTVAQVWAECKDVSSSEVVDVKIVGLNVREYRTHYHPDIIAKKIQSLYIKDDGVEYDVHGFEVLGRKKHLRFKCQKRE